MKYIARETAFRENEKRTAGAKARVDIDRICTEQLGYTPVDIVFDTARFEDRNIVGQLGEHSEALHEWEKKTAHLTKGDLLLIQFPPVNHSLMLSRQLSRLKGRGVSLVAILHDVEILRGAKRKNKSLKNRMRKHFEEQLCLGYFDRIVVHNKAMKEAVAELCGIPSGRMRSLGLFDYLCGETKSRNFGRGVAIAGNLRPDKSGYAYQLPGNMRWNLYGIQFSGKAFLPGADTDPESFGVYYHGSFLADEIADRIDGSFGLVWDGASVDTCEGVFGEGMPVIVWKEAAIAGYILKEKCGIAVESISIIPKILEEMTDEEYHILAQNAEKVGKRLRRGDYTRKVLSGIESEILPV